MRQSITNALRGTRRSQVGRSRFADRRLRAHGPEQRQVVVPRSRTARLNGHPGREEARLFHRAYEHIGMLTQRMEERYRAAFRCSDEKKVGCTWAEVPHGAILPFCLASAIAIRLTGLHSVSRAQKSSEAAAEPCSYIQPTYDSIGQTSNHGHD